MAPGSGRKNNWTTWHASTTLSTKRWCHEDILFLTNCAPEKVLPMYPSDWPADCPPKNAVDARGEYYRRVKNKPPSANDFRSPKEEGTFLNAKVPECSRVALSLDSSRETLQNLIDLRYHGYHIAMATLLPEHGRILATPSKGSKTHTSWWKTQETSAEKLFKCPP
ncbi:MAG: hypothetical protein HQL56_18140 [Magnetococcales bacterium]|nr:hypothetical protein [Magnetococcales bacterium]